jgi:hypothetical protein
MGGFGSVFPLTRGIQTFQPPRGAQAGGLKPPLPVGIPWGLMLPADINLSTPFFWQQGHSGSGSSAFNIKHSNSLWQ